MSEVCKASHMLTKLVRPGLHRSICTAGAGRAKNQLPPHVLKFASLRIVQPLKETDCGEPLDADFDHPAEQLTPENVSRIASGGAFLETFSGR